MKTANDLKIPFSWEERRPVLLERFFYLPAKYDYKKKAIPFFADNKPIAIEYCSGNGQWIVEKAAREPHKNWLAVEKRFERARKIWVKGQNLPNLTVVCGGAEIFTRYYAPAVCEGYINFPDPWPKLRHAKHRLVQYDFLKDLAQILQGSIICVTDDDAYYRQMKEELAKVFTPVYDQTEWPESYGDSFFKGLWVSKGKTIHYLKYEAVTTSTR